MTLKEVLSRLESLGNEKVRAHNSKFGAGPNQYGVKMGDIRALAKEIKSDHTLGLELWKTGNTDARFLAVLILKPNLISDDDISLMVRSEKFVHIADWFTSYILKKHPGCERLRIKWMTSSDPMEARAAWGLTSDLVARGAAGIDIPLLLKRIETEMAEAAPEVQWTMNFTLAHIGINHPEYRVQCIETGEKLGIYKDYPVSKGCTSPYAPVWINEMVRRQK
jgi:3-methyladenine DNA glycosylase AlkD